MSVEERLSVAVQEVECANRRLARSKALIEKLEEEIKNAKISASNEIRKEFCLKLRGTSVEGEKARETIRNLEEKLKRVEKVVLDCETEKETWRLKYEEEREKCLQFESDVIAIQTSYQEDNAKFACLPEMENDLFAARKRARKLEKDCAALENALESCHEKMEENSSTENALRADLQEMKGRNEILTEYERFAKGEISRLQKSLEELTLEKVKIADDQRAFQKRRNDFIREISSVMEAFEIRKEVDEGFDELREGSFFDELRGEGTGEFVLLRRVREVLVGYKESGICLKAENDTLKTLADSSQRNVNKCKEYIAEANETIKMLKRRCAQLQTESDRRIEIISSLKKDREEINGKMEAYAARHREFCDKWRFEVIEIVNNFKRKLSRLKHRCKSLKKEKEALIKKK